MLNATLRFPIQLRRNTLPAGGSKLVVGFGEFEMLLVEVSAGMRATVEGVTVAVVTVRGDEEATDKLVIVDKVEFVVVRGGERVETSVFQENQNKIKNSLNTSSYFIKVLCSIFPPIIRTT